MKKFLTNYKQTLILLSGILIGAIVGLIFKEKAAVLAPFGDVFLNLMLVIIVPLIFLTISTSISKMKQPKRLGKIMITIVVMILITSLIAVLFGILSTFFVKLVNPEDGVAIKESLVEVVEEDGSESEKELNMLERTVATITVNDFNGLLSKSNIIAIIVFSIIFGIAMNMAGEKAKPVESFLNSANEIVNNIIKILMYYAPFGLGCYVAALIGTFGSEMLVGYAKTFAIYFAASIIFYIVVYTIYAYIAGGKRGVTAYWKNVVPPTVTALATCSSAAAIPNNIQAVKNIGVSDDIADTMVPLGTNMHKDGSIIGSVFKIMFLVSLFGTGIGIAGIGQILLVALLATLLIAAVPLGGGTISETLIITMMGFPLAALPILTVIATIIDAPATMLNVVGNTSASMLVARVVDGKDWMDKEKNETENIKTEKK